MERLTRFAWSLWGAATGVGWDRAGASLCWLGGRPHETCGSQFLPAGGLIQSNCQLCCMDLALHCCGVQRQACSSHRHRMEGLLLLLWLGQACSWHRALREKLLPLMLLRQACC